MDPNQGIIRTGHAVLKPSELDISVNNEHNDHNMTIDILNESGDNVLEVERDETELTVGPTVTIVTTLEEPQLSFPPQIRDTNFKRCLFCAHYKLVKDIVNMENMSHERQKQAAVCLGIEERWMQHRNKYGKSGIAFCRSHFSPEYFRKLPNKNLISRCEICNAEVPRSDCECIQSVVTAMELDKLTGSGTTILSAYDRCHTAAKKVYICKSHVPAERSKTKPSYRFECFFCEETKDVRVMTRIYSKFKAAALEKFLDCAPEMTDELESEEMLWLCKSHEDEYIDKCAPELKLTLSQISSARARVASDKKVAARRRKKTNPPPADEPTTSTADPPKFVTCIYCKDEVDEKEALRIAIKRIAEHYEGILRLPPGTISKHVVFNSKTSIPTYLCKSHISSCCRNRDPVDVEKDKDSKGAKRKPSADVKEGEEGVSEKKSKEGYGKSNEKTPADEEDECASDCTWYSDSEDDEIDVEDQATDYALLAQTSQSASSLDPTTSRSFYNPQTIGYKNHPNTGYNIMRATNYGHTQASNYSYMSNGRPGAPPRVSQSESYKYRTPGGGAVYVKTGGTDYDLLTGEKNSKYQGSRVVYTAPPSALRQLEEPIKQEIPARVRVEGANYNNYYRNSTIVSRNDHMPSRMN